MFDIEASKNVRVPRNLKSDTNLFELFVTVGSVKMFGKDSIVLNSPCTCQYRYERILDFWPLLAPALLNYTTKH